MGTEAAARGSIRRANDTDGFDARAGGKHERMSPIEPLIRRSVVITGVMILLTVVTLGDSSLFAPLADGCRYLPLR